MRLCSACKVEKPPSEFWKRKGCTDGLNRRCKTCLTAYNRTYQQSSGAKLSKKKSHLKLVFGVSLESLPELCELCPSAKKICVDHDHTTGKIRGFLCANCNAGIGYAKDNPELLRRWADYLEKHNAG